MTRTLSLICILLSCTASPLRAQGGFDPDSSLSAILDTLPGTRLSLSEATSGAARNAVRLRIAEAAYFAAKGSARKERGLFDPTLVFGINYADRDDPTASFFSGAPVLSTVQTDASAGLRWQLPTGTGIEATLSSVKLRTNSSFAFLNPQYNAYGTLRLRQSLLGGLWVSGRKNLSRADEEERMMKARYDQEKVATATEAEKMYWDLHGAERNYAVQRLIRDQALQFLKDTEVRAAAGLVGPDQLASARTFIAEQELFLIDREEQFAAVSDRVAELIGVRPELRFMTTEHPASSYPVEPAALLLETAKRNNLSLEAARADVEARRALADAAGWEWLPTVNLVGAIGGSGLSGDAREVIFGSDTLRTVRGGTYTDALRQATRREFPNWSVGLEVSIPIGFRSGRGEKDKLEAELLHAEQRYLDEGRRIESSLLQNHRDVSNGGRRLGLARQAVEAAAEQVRIGLIEFKNGRATAFELVRLSADFAAAQNRYSDALVKTAKAAAMLRQLTSGVYPGDISQERNDPNE